MMQEVLDKLSLRKLRLVLTGVAVIASVAVGAIAVVPAAKQLVAVNKDAKTLAIESTNDEELGLQLAEQLKLNDKLSRQLQGDMANLPLQQVEAFVIGRLQRISWNNDVDLVSVEPATGEKIQVFQEILFNVRLVGQYEDLYAWLLETRNELGFVVVKEFSLKRDDAADSRPQLMANLSLASYRANR